MTQIADEYRSAQTAFAEALAYELGMNTEDICSLLNRDPVGLALDDLHAAWLQFSDEQDFGAEVAAQDLLDAMADEAAIDADTTAAADDTDFEERQRAEEEAAWSEHCAAFPMDSDDDWDDVADRGDLISDDDDWTPEDDL